MQEVIITHVVTEHDDCGCCKGGTTYPVTKVYRFEFEDGDPVGFHIAQLKNAAIAGGKMHNE